MKDREYRPVRDHELMLYDNAINEVRGYLLSLIPYDNKSMILCVNLLCNMSYRSIEWLKGKINEDKYMKDNIDVNAKLIYQLVNAKNIREKHEQNGDL